MDDQPLVVDNANDDNSILSSSHSNVPTTTKSRSCRSVYKWGSLFRTQPLEIAKLSENGIIIGLLFCGTGVVNFI